MAKQWTPEVDISFGDARRIIEADHPVRVQSISEFGAGWDNIAYLVNDRFVFRFPRRKLGAQIMEYELLALPVVNRISLLHTPHLQFQGRFGGEHWPYMGYPLIAGTTACRAHLSPQERAGCAKPLAEFLRALHSTDTASLQRDGMCGDTIRRIDVEYRAQKTTALLHALADKKLLSGIQPLLAVLEQGRGQKFDLPKNLVHGDLYVRHLIVDAGRRLCGIIDWGDCHLGHPALDLAVAHTFLPPELHTEFLRAYGPVDEQTWLLARFRAVCLNAVLLEFAADTCDEALLRETTQAFDFIRSAN